jgi:hypothetical protein
MIACCPLGRIISVPYVYIEGINQQSLRLLRSVRPRKTHERLAFTGTLGRAFCVTTMEVGDISVCAQINVGREMPRHSRRVSTP